MAKKIVETPLMKQYFEMKQKHPDAVLLFRVGDFYETFSDDAITASEILGITLTRRANGAASSVELAGFPHHALDTYLPKLVRAGKRVAICEQLEDPKLTKKLVKRGITELVTPGVATGDNILSGRENNFLAAIHFGRDGRWGVAFLDISTGEFMVSEGAAAEMEKLLASMSPKEVLVERGHKRDLDAVASQRYLVFDLDDWVFTEPTARERLHKQFETTSLKGFGVNDMNLAIVAAGAILHYLDVTQHTRTAHISALQRIDESRYVRLDPFTVRNLELLRSMADDGKSLLQVIDRTVTPMGARLLARWVRFPLRDPKAINRRLDVVEHFFRTPELRDNLTTHLGRIGDLQRLLGKAASGRINPREMTMLRQALEEIKPVKQMCAESGLDTLAQMAGTLDACDDLRRRIEREIAPDAPADVSHGGVIRQGFCPELDELRALSLSSKQYLEAIRRREVEATGISSLKISYNKVFGYYLEVTNTHRDKVPPEWIRKQTLTSAERYITPELKELEDKILSAQDRIAALEPSLFRALVDSVGQYIPLISADAETLSRLDCLVSLTRVALDNRYNRPVVDDSLVIEIKDGRHPVIERELPIGEPYITNSVKLDNDTQQIMMITGPNMSGKSALLRQTALNVLLAQIGSFVAAESAHIGVVDKIFTRVGASDNISHGESTFMVEMNEAASILNNISRRSLILFDELGRGTSTYDGISIAWAIVEYIHNHADMRPKTLFATHYHELNEMEGQYERVVNYNVSVREIDGRVVFLRKLARGGSEHSFGIHVAKLAGMPRSIVKRADEVLRHLEKINASSGSETIPAAPAPVKDGGMQMSFFQLDDPVLSQIRDEILHIEIDRLTPLDALNKLHGIKKILTGH